jgi:hypothetical protein
MRYILRTEQRHVQSCFEVEETPAGNAYTRLSEHTHTNAEFGICGENR